MHKQIVAYDVPATHDILRRKIANKLFDYGLERIQYSVFIGNLSQNMLDNMKLDIINIIGQDPADVRVFHLDTIKQTVDDIWAEYKTFEEPIYEKQAVVF